MSCSACVIKVEYPVSSHNAVDKKGDLASVGDVARVAHCGNVMGRNGKITYYDVNPMPLGT